MKIRALMAGLCAMAVASWTFGSLGCGGDDHNLQCAELVAPPDVAGMYVLDSLALTGSDCDPAFTNGVVDAITATTDTCDFRVSQAGTNITVRDCDDIQYVGCVDESGVVTASGTFSESAQGCTVRVDILMTSNLSSVLTTADFDIGIDAAGNCTAEAHCTLQLSGEFLAASGASTGLTPGLSGTVDGPLNTLVSVVDNLAL